MLNRRKFIRASTAVAVGAGFPHILQAANHQKETTVLGIWPFTGPYADMGPLLNWGAEIALEEVNYEVAGKKINYITRDSETKAGTAARRAQGAIDSEDVKFIVGPWSSGVALAVTEVAKKNKVMYYFSGQTLSQVRLHVGGQRLDSDGRQPENLQEVQPER
jgi:branched-chain amino acid transport system substrate-binding protein